MLNVGLIMMWQSIVVNFWDSMSANEFIEVPHAIGCKIPQDRVW